MAGRYVEHLNGGYTLNVTDDSMWIEHVGYESEPYGVFAISHDGREWDVCIDYNGLGVFYRREVVDHVNSWRDDLSDVTDLLDIWEELVLDRGYMVQHGLAASKSAELLDGGNCFETAWDNMFDSVHDVETFEPELYLCHGICTYEGDIEFTHAWNETLDGEYVIDTSNGNDLFMPRWRYYEIFDVDESSVHRYKYLDGYAEMERTMKWGPWAPELQFVQRPKFAFDIPDENRNGNCYEVAWKNAMDDSNLLVCHGVVHGQGVLEGIEFPHAWNEFSDGDYVLDESNGNAICMPRDVYYSMARLDPSSVLKYDYLEAMKNAATFGTYGPWVPELMFDYREV